jgi:hypothetical protein
MAACAPPWAKTRAERCRVGGGVLHHAGARTGRSSAAQSMRNSSAPHSRTTHERRISGPGWQAGGERAIEEPGIRPRGRMPGRPAQGPRWSRGDLLRALAGLGEVDFCGDRVRCSREAREGSCFVEPGGVADDGRTVLQVLRARPHGARSLRCSGPRAASPSVQTCPLSRPTVCWQVHARCRALPDRWPPNLAVPTATTPGPLIGTRP